MKDLYYTFDPLDIKDFNVLVTKSTQTDVTLFFFFQKGRTMSVWGESLSCRELVMKCDFVIEKSAKNAYTIVKSRRDEATALRMLADYLSSI